MNKATNIKEEQQKYYSEEWKTLELSDKPGRSGWRTNVPAPDFIQFAAWLKEKSIKGKALDLGCGGGRHSIVLAQADFEVYGIDFAESAIKQADRNAATAGVSDATHFQVGDTLTLPYGDKFFDVINDDGCLHHIDPKDWPMYVRNIQRVIKPGGILRIKAFSKNCGYFRANSPDDTQWTKLKDSGYTYFFTEQDIRRLFEDGFEFIKLEEKAHTQASDKMFFFGILRSF